MPCLVPTFAHIPLDPGFKALAGAFNGLHSIKSGVWRVRSGTPMPAILQSLQDM